jgi:hypothetical protein
VLKGIEAVIGGIFLWVYSVLMKILLILKI